MWLERLHAAPFLAERWLSHQRRDDYWKHGSVVRRPGAITCAVYAVGGWADGYTQRHLPDCWSGLSCPRKALIGPWEHLWPEEGIPGPAIGFLQESLRWWDHWLKGIDTGIMDEPQLRFWMQDSAPPMRIYDQRPGRWAAEPAWPSPRIVPQTLAVNDAGLGTRPEPTARSATPARSRSASTRDRGCPTEIRPTCPVTSAPRTPPR